MKSVYSPVSSDSRLSDTIKDEPGVIISAIRSTSSGGMMMRSSAALGLGIGAATSTAFTACSRRPLRPLSEFLASAARRKLLGIETTVQRKPPSALAPMAV